MANHLVFVYGTLRKHERNHHLLRDAVCIARQSWTVGRLIDSEFGYPYLVSSANGRVYGELYEVNHQQLIGLDHLEGYHGPGQDNYYERMEQVVYTDRGSVLAFVYTLPFEKLKQKPKQIKSGDWRVERLVNQKQSLYYFAYGSCMDDARFKLAGVNHYFQKLIGCGILDGYQLRFTRRLDDGGRADIVEEGGLVEGKIYEIPPEALDYLYRREGVNAGSYRPTLVDLTVNDGRLVNVLTFVVVDKEAETAPPDHYAEEILRGGSGCLSEAYLEKIKSHINDLMRRII